MPDIMPAKHPNEAQIYNFYKYDSDKCMTGAAVISEEFKSHQKALEYAQTLAKKEKHDISFHGRMGGPRDFAYYTGAPAYENKPESM